MSSRMVPGSSLTPPKFAAASGKGVLTQNASRIRAKPPLSLLTGSAIICFDLVEPRNMEQVMTPAASPTLALAQLIVHAGAPEHSIRERAQLIQAHVLERSNYLREPDFKAIHPRDLELLFTAYDERFFSSLFGKALEGRMLSFRLSSKMTRAGGKTAKFVMRNGEVRYEISIASGILFDGFDGSGRAVTVCGLECRSRLDALQRIFEHELVHLAEQLCWEQSNCAAPRFQNVAARLFLHRAHTHNLVTRKERAAELGIRIGALVAFSFEGRRLTGRVNRITKRATVLVADPEGVPFSDGLRYKTYYVPIGSLQPVMAQPAK